MNHKDSKKPAAGKSKNALLLILVAAALLIIAAVLLALFMPRDTSKDKVEENLESLLSQEFEPLESDTVGNVIAETVFSHASFKVNSVQDDTAVITVTAPNLYFLYMQAIAPYKDVVPEDEDEYHALVDSTLATVLSELENRNYEMITRQVTVNLNDDQEIEVSYELVDALYGGLLSLQEALVESYWR